MACSSYYTAEQCGGLSIARILIAVLSVIGSLFLIFVISLFRKYRRLNYRILLYIAICSFFNAFTILLAGGMREAKDNAWCTIRGASLQFFAWGIMVWQLALTANMFLNTLFMGSNRSYDVIESWIDDPEWRIWAFYLEFVVGIFIILVLYAKVVFTVLTLRPRWRERHTESVKYEVYKRRIRPMMFYPLAILLVSVVPVVYRMKTFLHPGEPPSYVLAVMHVVSVPLWGVLFAVVYGLDPETRADLSWANIKSTMRDRMYGDSIEQVDIRVQTATTTTTDPKPPTKAANRESNISAISIEASTVYQSASVRK